LAVPLMSLLMASPSAANRTACIGSNGERALADGVASGNERAMASLPVFLDEIATASHTELLVFQVFGKSAAEASNQYQLRDLDGRFLITLTEVSPTRVALSVERACQSESAEGWQSGWKITLTRLEQQGFSVIPAKAGT